MKFFYLFTTSSSFVCIQIQFNFILINKNNFKFKKNAENVQNKNNNTRQPNL